MTDLAKTIIPKSDQLNADDLIAGSITITITKVTGNDSEADQPISIHFEGDNRKPYKPCKSMRRVMVHAWGADGNTYAGKRMTLYCDSTVQFGGIKVGGIRISHMSHIDREMVVALTVTRAKRMPYTVKPLRADVRPGPASRPVADRSPAPREDEQPAGDRYTGGFRSGAEEETASEAVLWMRGVFEDLEGDVFRSTDDLDAFYGNPENVRQFEALKDEDASLSKKLEAALNGRGKALTSRR